MLGAKTKDHLVEWRARVGAEEADRITKAAADRGTKVHNLCEAYLCNRKIDYSQLDIKTIDMFMSMRSLIDKIDQIYTVEGKLYSDYLKVAGTADCIAQYDGKRSIIDFKTSTKEKKESWIENYFMQCAAYAVMFEERTNIPVNQLVVLIAVEGSDPQLFIKKRDEWIYPCIKLIKEFHENG